MNDSYYEINAEDLSQFKEEAGKVFAAICNSFGLQEENVILSDTDNLFQIRIVIFGL